MSTLATPINTQLSTAFFTEKEPLNRIQQLLLNRLACHILFWMIVFIFNAAYISYIEYDWRITLYNFFLRMPFIIACCYVNLYWLLPKYYYPGRLLLYVSLVLGTILTLNIINLFVLESFSNTPICPKSYESLASFTWNNYVYKAFYLISIVGLTSGIKLSKGYLLEKQKTDAIEKEKLQTELSLLKSQIHPHFFFNTLNNLYALTLKKSDLAPGMLLRLSELMSYSLYESDGTYVSLSKEIKHIQNYIELESLRFGSKVSIEFNVIGLKEDKLIPPLIFLPIIENCFKHTSSGQSDISITISLTIHDDTATLRTCNPFTNDKNKLSGKGGLGLRNVHRRLQLLYDDAYHLETESSGRFFTVTLQIPLQ
jgi:sensor histidine kinase YesM